jgi:L-asparaginase
MTSKVVILGSGGTIAGTGAAGQALGYTAAQLGVQALVSAVPRLAQVPLECEQVAQLDSKDMDHVTWQRLAQRAAHHLARDDVAGVVITHGTDTLEETAYFLHRVLAPTKPLVLTAAMRPATALSADGPANLADAVAVARHPGAQGVVVVMAGTVHAGSEVRKLATTALDAFSSGDAGPLAQVDGTSLRQLRAWPTGQPTAQPMGLNAIAPDASRWPWVAVVTSHAGATGAEVDALVAAGVAGLVVAATGNGTVHHRLEAALARAQAQGVRVVRATRCALGRIIDTAPAGLAHADHLTPAQARVQLLLALLAPSHRGDT